MRPGIDEGCWVRRREEVRKKGVRESDERSKVRGDLLEEYREIYGRGICELVYALNAGVEKDGIDGGVLFDGTVTLISTI